MPAYENLWKMLGDIQSFARETGATINLADNPRGLVVGFSATVDGQIHIWEISLVDLKKNMHITPTDLPDSFDFIQANFRTEEARRQLAARLTAGEMPWWGTSPHQRSRAGRDRR